MFVFDTCSDAYSDVCCGHLTDQGRSCALKYIFLDSYYSLDFIKNNLFKSEEELHKAINSVLNRPSLAIDLLLFYDEFLTVEERNAAIEKSLQYWDSAYKLVESYSGITPEIRFQALDKITMNLSCTKKFLLNCNPSQEERLYVVRRLIRYKEILICCLDTFHEVGFDRELAFNTVIFFPDEVLKLAMDGKLFSCEVKAIYLKHSKYYFEKSKRNFSRFYNYCKIFYRYLSKEEKQLFIHKLKSKRYSHLIEIALKEIKFSKEYKELLLGQIVMNKLTRPICSFFVPIIAFSDTVIGCGLEMIFR